MPRFLTRLVANSSVRLSKRAYRVDGEVKSFVFPFPDFNVAVLDRFTPLANELVPNGLVIQVESEAADITTAIDQSRNRALPVLSLLSLTAGAFVNVPVPIWSYEVTPDATSRQWRYNAYDHRLSLPSRAAEQLDLLEVWTKLDQFQNRTDVKPDFKARLVNSLQSYRRALSDNDDALSEFLALWSSIEAIDCLYRHVFQTAQTREFKDGMRDVFKRLNQPAAFDELEKVRNDLAHGSIDQGQARVKAKENIELVRSAVKLMALRIIGCDDAMTARLLEKKGIKGKYPPHLRLVGTIEISPVDVSDFGNQPEVAEHIDPDVKTERNGDRLTFFPPFSIRLLKPGPKLSVNGWEMWGEENAPIKAHLGATAEVIKGPQT